MNGALPSLTPVDEALAKILAAISPVGTEPVPVEQSFGRVLAADVLANITQPPSTVSAMDGYAVRAADVAQVPAALKRIGEAPAGGVFAGAVESGTTVRIFTGGPLPEGADTVVMQENTSAHGDMVTVNVPDEAGRNVRPQGLDFVEGTVMLTAGRRLTARDVGLAAAANVSEVTVRQRPRVAFLATGSELVRPGEASGPVQIVNSNTPALAAMAIGGGAEAVDLGIATDDAETLKTLAAKAADADMFVTIGGASVGDHDLVQKVLGEVGLVIDFWRVAMRPGKPMMFGRFGDVPMLGLPGNPVSAMVCALVFLRPAIAALQGLAEITQPTIPVKLGRDLPANGGRQAYLRARLERDDKGAFVATPMDEQDSSLVSVLSDADCFVLRAIKAGPALKGEMAEALPFTLSYDGY